MKIIIIYFQTLICLLILSLVISCSKSNGSDTPTPPPTPVEETILFTIDIDQGSSVYAALSATQDAKITISSKIPTAGITVDVVVKKDLDNTTVSNGTYSTSLSPFTATISNLLPGVLYTATFTVTSKSKPSNFAIKSFKVARK